MEQVIDECLDVDVESVRKDVDSLPETYRYIIANEGAYAVRPLN